MRMRCFVPSECWAEEEIRVAGAEAHYLRDVRRIGAGDSIQVFDGGGRTAAGQCLDVTRSAVRLRVETPVVHPRPAPVLHLVQSLAKGKRMDWLLQKATELGVDEIHPLCSRRAVVKIDGGDAEKKRDRWGDIVLSAVRQCGRPWAPVIHPVAGLKTCLVRFSGETLLVGDMGPDAVPLGQVVQSLADQPLASVGIAIGPEGDWTDEERDALASAGGISVNLGHTTLRTETAALYALSVFRFLFREPSMAKEDVS
jgi:16S rRNA (uracil1498-N3)-methyltransferase